MLLESIVQNELNSFQKRIENVENLTGSKKLLVALKEMNDDNIHEMKTTALVDYHDYMSKPRRLGARGEKKFW